MGDLGAERRAADAEHRARAVVAQFDPYRRRGALVWRSDAETDAILALAGVIRDLGALVR